MAGLINQEKETYYCVNYLSCQLVNTNNIVPDEQKRLFYINNFCRGNKDTWKKCKRYVTKEELNFCPDFVLPDSLLTTNEIIEEFDRLQEEGR